MVYAGKRCNCTAFVCPGSWSFQWGGINGWKYVGMSIEITKTVRAIAANIRLGTTSSLRFLDIIAIRRTAVRVEFVCGTGMRFFVMRDHRTKMRRPLRHARLRHG